MCTKRWPAVLAVWAVLFAGTTNAHAHVRLCLDGQDRPASVHVVADDAHHLHEHAQPHRHEHPQEQPKHHDDVDLDVPNDALAKKIGNDLPAIDAPAALLAVATDVHVRAAARAAAIDPQPPPPYTRPQLRAPPF